MSSAHQWPGRAQRRVAAGRPRPILLALAALAAVVTVLVPSIAARADPSPSDIDSQIRTESASLEQTVEEYNRATEELAATQTAANALAAQIQPLASRLDQTSRWVTELAVRAYQGGAIAEFSGVLGATDPAAVIDRMTTLEQLSRVERGHLADARAAKAAYDGQAAHYQQLIAEQTAHQQALDAQRTQINADLAHLYDLRRAAYGQAQTAGARYSGTPPAVSGKAGVAVAFAYAAIGTPYVWAGASPSGYDCSGLTMAAWGAAGVSLPHNAAMQWNALPHIGRDALSPGDLVFYSNLGHVAIYVGGGQIIHAPTFGDYVRLASVDMMTPYGYARPG